MPKLLDTYQKWEADGVLTKILKDIEEMFAKRIIQNSIADSLGITAKTFIKLKKKYPLVRQAIYNGESACRAKLEDTAFKLAMGYEYVEENQFIEEVNGKQKRKVIKHKNISIQTLRPSDGF